jgi:hypothetical protein
MVVRGMSGDFLIDPDGVNLEGVNGRPNFRVTSTQRLKVHGVRLVGCFEGRDVDVLQDCCTSKKTIALAEEGPTDKKILVLNTIKCPVFDNMKRIKVIVEGIKKINRSAMVHNFDKHEDIENANDKDVAEAISMLEVDDVPDSVMAFNLADAVMKRGPEYIAGGLDAIPCC